MNKIEMLRQHNLAMSTRECKQFKLIIQLTNKFVMFYNNNNNIARTQ